VSFCKATIWCIRAASGQNAAQNYVVPLGNLAHETKWRSKTLRRAIFGSMSSSEVLNSSKLMFHEGNSWANSPYIKMIRLNNFGLLLAMSLEASPLRSNLSLIKHLYPYKAKKGN